MSTTEEKKMKASALESLTQECLELFSKSHGNRGFAKIQASKILMAKTDLVQMPAKIDSARAAYERIADGRNYGEAMKVCALLKRTESTQAKWKC